VSVVTVQCGAEMVGESCGIVDGVDDDRGWW
jgi:hypothetical protein